MPSAIDRIEFLPPAPPGMLRAFGLAILAHLFLLAALTWGVHWKRQQSDTLTAEAELWAKLPQPAAPKAQEPSPPPLVPEPVEPKVMAPPPPAPEVKPEPQPAKVDIALEKEKEKKKQLALLREEERQQEIDAKLKEDKAKQAADKKALEAQAQKKAAQKKAQDEAQRVASAAAAQADKDAKESAEQREANLRRMTGLAGASGGPGATGVAAQSAGWSSSYGGRVKARVKPNVVFSGSTSGNPGVTLRVKLGPDGTILGRPQVLKSSGNPEWDEAVVRAFEKTEVLPRDVDGQVRSELEVIWRPND